MFRRECCVEIMLKTVGFQRRRLTDRGIRKTIIGESLHPVQMARSVFDLPGPPKASPVIVMHGLMGSRVNWSSVAKTLCSSTHRKVITVDARNHGNSPHTPDHSYEHMACDIKRLVEEVGAERVALIGHSMGGRAAMYFALCWPQLVEKLIVVDISPARVSPSLSQTRQYLEAMRSLGVDPDLPLSRARRQADEQLSNVVPDLGMRQFLLMNLVPGADGKACRWRVNLESILRNYDRIANFPPTGGTYEGPTIFIAGKLSDFIRPEDEPAIRAIFPAALFEYVSGASHLVHIDKPQEFVRIVSQFLSA